MCVVLQTFPLSVVPEYCGRSYLLVHVDSSGEIMESDELDNVFAKEFFIKCTGGGCCASMCVYVCVCVCVCVCVRVRVRVRLCCGKY